MRFRPQLPGRDTPFSLTVEMEREQRNPPDFSIAPTPPCDYPQLSELFPTAELTPASFKPTDVRYWTRLGYNARYVDAGRVSMESAIVVYTPSGEIGDQGVHLACRISLVDEEQRTHDGIAAWHRETVLETFDGNPDRPIHSDWVTSELGQKTAYDHERTTYYARYPRLFLEGLPASIERPVDENAFVVQSTDWGLIETGAYLTPKPDSGQAQELAELLADTVAADAQQCSCPVERKHESEREEAVDNRSRRDD